MHKAVNDIGFIAFSAGIHIDGNAGELQSHPLWKSTSVKNSCGQDKSIVIPIHGPQD